MAKTETTVIRVKGTRHYKAEDVFNKGKLNSGASIELRPEPNNRFDPNAVEVLLNNGDKLGHISKDIAPKYQKLCIGGSILTATLESADKTSDYAIRGLDVRVKITYLSSTVNIDHELSASPGVYEISLGLGRAYVGSTGNLKNRVRQHFSQLNDLIHQNKPLQADFRRVGPEQFNFEVVKHCENASQALRLEEQEITRRLAAGLALYNKTQDGRGRRPDNPGSTTTISDIQDPSSLPPRDTQPSVRKNIANKQAPESLQTSTPEDAPRTGYYSLTLADGSVFEGEFKDGKRHGFGRCIYPAGDLYEGNWSYDKRHGLGRMEWSFGNSYEGAWQENQITGTGRYSWKNGDSYEGSWLDGKRSGPGTFFELGKEPITTLWENDKSLGSQDGTTVHLKNADSDSKGSQSHKQKAAQSDPLGNYAERLAVMAEAAEFVAEKLPTDGQLKQAAQASRATSNTFNEVVQGAKFVDAAIDGDLAGTAISLFGPKFTKSTMDKVGIDKEFLDRYYINQDDAVAAFVKTELELAKGTDLGDAIGKGFGDYIKEGGALAPNNMKTPEFIKKIGDAITASGRMYDEVLLEPVKSAVRSESMTGPADAERVNLSNGDTYTGSMKDNKRHGVGKYEFVGGAVYEGDFVDGKRTGRGTYTFANGDVYEGDWLDGDKTGKGTYTFANGDVYEGDWLDGDKTGKGTYTSADGDVYEGVWLEGKRHGPGILKTVKGEEFKQTYRDGDLEKSSEVTSEAIGVEQKDGISDAVLTTSEGDYRGNVKDGVPHGLGIMEYANGDYYDGEWRDGVKSGEGCEFLEDGESYVGSFLDDARHGKGRCSDAGGDEYDGEWVKGELIEKLYNDSHSQDVTRLEAPDGRVSYKYANGDLYRGGWENGMPEGTGSMSYHNGDSYVGKWQAGQFHGTGVKKNADGDSFDGFWKQGKMHGRGVAQYSDGDTYEGQWANDLHHGKGIFTTADGQVYEGTWHEGEPD